MTFREFVEYNEYIKINEIFDIIDNKEIIQISFSEFIKINEVMVKKHAPDFFNNYTSDDLVKFTKDDFGNRVKYFKFKDYLIIYGKIKSSNRFEIHFWDIKNLEYSSSVNNIKITNIFSAVMTVIINFHLKTNAKLYISSDEVNRLNFYFKIINSMLKKYKLPWKLDINKELILKPDVELTEKIIDKYKIS